MEESKIAIALFIILLASPFISAICITPTEETALRQMANASNISGDIIINLYERLCSSTYITDSINQFNATLNTRLDAMNTQVSSTINNSALVTSLNQISALYNQSLSLNNDSIYVNNRLIEIEGRINSRQDNQTINLLNQFNSLKTDVMNELADKQSNALTTNRLVMIIIGIGVLIGVFIYFSRRRISGNRNVNPLPYDMEGLRKGINTDYNETSNSTGKSKGKPRK